MKAGKHLACKIAHTFTSFERSATWQPVAVRQAKETDFIAEAVTATGIHR
jgi:hypothetical protein